MSRRRKAHLVVASVIAVICPMVLPLDLGYAVLPHLAGSFAIAKSGNGGSAGGSEAGNHDGGGSGRGGSDRSSAGNHGGGNGHGNGGGPSRGGPGRSGRDAGSADKGTIPGLREIGPKRTDSAQRRAAARALGLHGPAQGQRPTLSAQARDRRVKPRRARHTLVASGLTDADLAKLKARGFRIQARTKGSLIPRTVRLRPPHGLSLDQARRAVRMINANAVIDSNGYYYTDGDTPEGLAMETPDELVHAP